MSTKIFVNLPVRNVGASVGFFTELGFPAQPEFTSEQAGCVVLGDGSYAMLLDQEFFATATSREIADAAKVTEVVIALQLESRAEVDRVVDGALARGGEANSDVVEDEYLYSRGFHDLDGHLWNVVCMKTPQ